MYVETAGSMDVLCQLKPSQIAALSLQIMNNLVKTVPLWLSFVDCEFLLKFPSILEPAIPDWCFTFPAL